MMTSKVGLALDVALTTGCRDGHGRGRFDGLARATLLTAMSPRLARAERFDIPVQRTYRTGHEDPEQYEEAVLEDRESKFSEHRGNSRGWGWLLLILRRGPIQDSGAADGDRVAVEQRGRLDMMAFDIHAVGGARSRAMTVLPLSVMSICMWRREMPGSSITISQSDPRPMMVLLSVSRYWCSPISSIGQSSVCASVVTGTVLPCTDSLVSLKLLLVRSRSSSKITTTGPTNA